MGRKIKEDRAEVSGTTSTSELCRKHGISGPLYQTIEPPEKLYDVKVSRALYGYLADLVL